MNVGIAGSIPAIRSARRSLPFGESYDSSKEVSTVAMIRKECTCDNGRVGASGLTHTECKGKGYIMVEDKKGTTQPSQRWGKW